MNVLQICPHYYPATRFGGVVNVAHSISKELVKQGHHVCICTTNLSDRKHDLDVEIDAPVKVDGVTVFYESVAISRYWGFSTGLARRILEQCSHADIIFVHFHYQYASVIGGIISRLKKKPYIVFTHGSLNRFGINRQSRLRKMFYLSLAEKSNFSGAKFVAYHSPEELEHSIVLGRPRIVPNGIDTVDASQWPEKGRFRSERSDLESALIYLYLGRLAKGKGLQLLITAFKELLPSHPEARLVLAGSDEGSYVGTLRQLVQEHGLTNQVLFTGFVDGQRKLSILRDSDIYVLPSSSEGMSIAMLEAMAMGMPVIVSDRVGLCRTIQAEKCGVVVPQNYGRLVGALQDLANCGERPEMGARGRSLVASQFTWAVIVRDLISELRENA